MSYYDYGNSAYIGDIIMKRLKKDVWLHVDSGEIITTDKMDYGDTKQLVCGLIVIKTPFGVETL